MTVSTATTMTASLSWARTSRATRQREPQQQPYLPRDAQPFPPRDQQAHNRQQHQPQPLCSRTKADTKADRMTGGCRPSSPAAAADNSNPGSNGHDQGDRNQGDQQPR